MLVGTVCWAWLSGTWFSQEVHQLGLLFKVRLLRQLSQYTLKIQCIPNSGLEFPHGSSSFLVIYQSVLGIILQKVKGMTELMKSFKSQLEVTRKLSLREDMQKKLTVPCDGYTRKNEHNKTQLKQVLSYFEVQTVDSVFLMKLPSPRTKHHIIWNSSNNIQRTEKKIHSFKKKSTKVI